MKRLIVIRGGGEMATGIALTLHTAGFRVLMLERALPSATRREVTFSDAVYDGKKTVERVTCTFTKSKKEAEKLLKKGEEATLDTDYTFDAYTAKVAEVVHRFGWAGPAIALAGFTS